MKYSNNSRHHKCMGNSHSQFLISLTALYLYWTIPSTHITFYPATILRRNAIEFIFNDTQDTALMMELANCRDTVVVSIRIVDQRNRVTISRPTLLPIIRPRPEEYLFLFSPFLLVFIKSVSAARCDMNLCSTTKYTALF